MTMSTPENSEPGQPLAVPLSDQLGLAERLRAPSMTDTTATHIDRMRMAADEIDRLRAELARCGKDNCMGRKVQGTTTWVTLEAREAAVSAERERCAKLCDTAPERYDITGGPAELAAALAADIRA